MRCTARKHADQLQRCAIEQKYGANVLDIGQVVERIGNDDIAIGQNDDFGAEGFAARRARKIGLVDCLCAGDLGCSNQQKEEKQDEGANRSCQARSWGGGGYAFSW